jgi:transposase InsO family protein
MKFEVIDSQTNFYSTTLLCKLFGVSKSGYYNWKSRPKTRATEELRIVRLIEKIFQGSRGTYGSPRIFQILKGLRETCSEDKVARLMQKYGIKARTKRKFRHTTDSNHKSPIAENKLNQDFTASTPGEKLVGDITYISTDEGWLYLACVLDVYTRKIVGWQIKERMTKDLVIGALKNASRSLKFVPRSIFHSDRGSQYASQSFRRVLDVFGLDQSMSRKGNCYDNSMMESFFATLKKEFVYHTKFATRADAEREIFEWIEVFYNRQRIHSSIGYLTPCDFEVKCA